MAEAKPEAEPMAEAPGLMLKYVGPLPPNKVTGLPYYLQVGCGSLPSLSADQESFFDDFRF